MKGNNMCDYCLTTDVQLYKLKDWDNPDMFKFYCNEHWHQVRSFQKRQMLDFLKYYSSNRERLSQKQQKLYQRLEIYLK